MIMNAMGTIVFVNKSISASLVSNIVGIFEFDEFIFWSNISLCTVTACIYILVKKE